MALSAPGRSDQNERLAGQGGRDRAERYFQVIDPDSKTGPSDWKRSGFVFSGRIVRKDEGGVLLRSPFGEFLLRGEGETPDSGLVRLQVVRRGEAVLFRVLPAEGAGIPGPLSSGASDGPAAWVRALGLPPDAVSFSLLSFARAFGLRLEADTLQRLRRTVLRTRLDREATSLAATAAEAKGVRLGDEALSAYVSAMDADSGRRRGEDGRGNRGGERRRDGGGNAALGERADPEATAPSAESLRAAFEKAQGAGDALSFLNKLPGRDGTRWIVFSVDLGAPAGSADLGPDGQVEIRASVRILLVSTHDTNSGRIGRWAVDVSAVGRMWYFSAENLDSPKRSIAVRTDPPLGSEAPRVRAALEGLFAPFGLAVRVSSDRETGRFPDREAEPYEVFDAQA